MALRVHEQGVQAYQLLVIYFGLRARYRPHTDTHRRKDGLENRRSPRGVGWRTAVIPRGAGERPGGRRAEDGRETGGRRGAEAEEYGKGGEGSLSPGALKSSKDPHFAALCTGSVSSLSMSALPWLPWSVRRRPPSPFTLAFCPAVLLRPKASPCPCPRAGLHFPSLILNKTRSGPGGSARLVGPLLLAPPPEPKPKLKPGPRPKLWNVLPPPPRLGGCCWATGSAGGHGPHTCPPERPPLLTLPGRRWVANVI